MKLVFPYSPKDQDIAVLLASWIRELGGCRAHSVLVVRDRRCDPANDDAIKADLMAAFDGIEVLTVADDVYDKWPESANLMFKRAAKHIELGPSPEPFLWLEPDAIPLRAGWLDAIADEYVRARTAGKHFLGAKVEIEGVPLHMSGIAVYPGVMSSHAGQAYLTHEIAWDVWAADQIVPQAYFTKLIEHSWKRDSVTKENLRVTFGSCGQVENEVSKDAVIYHASKDGSLIARLRERQNNLPVPVLAKASPARIQLRTGSDTGAPESNDSGRRSSHTFDSGGGQSFTCDILIKSYPKDYERLSYCLRSIDKFASGFRKVRIILPSLNGPLPYPRHKHLFTIVQERGDPYLFQQAIKASAHEYTDADYVLHVDSDCLFTRPFTPETFMRDGKPLWLMTPYADFKPGPDYDTVMKWKAITEKFIGQPVEFEFMRRLPLFVPRALHVAAALFCKQKHGVSLTDYILAQPNREFTEFNALGALAYYRANEDFSWLDTSKEPLPEAVAIQDWSHAPFTDERKAEFETILSGGSALDDAPVPSSGDARDEDITAAPPSQNPWESESASKAELDILTNRLKRFCTNSVRTKYVRSVLHNAGVIELPYRYRRRRGKWKKRTAKA